MIINFVGNLISPSDVIWKKLSEVYCQHDNQESLLGTEWEIIDFEESLLETCLGAKKYISHERLYVRELRGDL